MVGHWLVIAITEANGTLDGVNALGTLEWSHPLTWIFQVMPLFFFVGGYANATSLQRHRDHGGDVLGWVVRRYRRLLGPSSALLAVLAVGVVAARATGVDHDDAGTGAWLATVPLWFLAAYLAIVAFAPLTHAAHQRFGLTVPVVAAVLVGAADLVRVHLEPWVANVNFVVAWLAIHQLGYAWHDGRLRADARFGARLALGGLAFTVLLVAVGPYPVSMVRAPGEALHNTEPPTLGLLGLAVTQIGVALWARGRASRWLARPVVWTWVSRIESVVLTLFLWHMAAALVAAVLLYGTGLVPVVPLDSGRWLLLRLPWLAACGLLLGLLVAVFGRVERPTRDVAPGGRAPGPLLGGAAVSGVSATVAGMLGIAIAGSGAHGPLGLPSWALAAYAAGFALLSGVAAHSRRLCETRPDGRRRDVDQR